MNTTVSMLSMPTPATCLCPSVEESRPPPGFVFPAKGPLENFSLCSGLALAVIREYAWGAESSYIARVTGLSGEHIDDALHRLRSEGFVSSAKERMSWYYESREAHLWRETFRPELLGQPLPQFVPEHEETDRIPPQFWWVFLVGYRPHVPAVVRKRLVHSFANAGSPRIPPVPSRRNLGVEKRAHLGSSTIASQSGLQGHTGGGKNGTGHIRD